MSTAIGPPPVTTTNEYSDANAAVFDFRGTPYAWGYLNIVGNAVLVSILVGTDQGQTDWSIDYPVFSGFLPLSSGSARAGGRPGDAIYGVRVRALTAGQQAQVTGAFFQAGETGIVPGATGSGAIPCPCGSTLIVTDGITTVSPTSEIDFTSGATVTDLGGGVAGVAVTGGSGIQFDTSPQVGTFLETTTTGAGPSGFSTLIEDSGAGGGIMIRINGLDSFLEFDLPSGDGTLRANNNLDVEANADMTLQATGDIMALVNGHNTIEAKLHAGNVPSLGFFGVTPVVRQATPATIADIVSLLQAYGLSL